MHILVLQKVRAGVRQIAKDTLFGYEQGKVVQMKKLIQMRKKVHRKKEEVKKLGINIWWSG